MTPINTQILFKPMPSDTISVGGILIPESAQQINNKGIIVAVGNGTKKKPMYLKPGQIGFRVKNWGTEIWINGQLHFLMDQDAILAKD